MTIRFNRSAALAALLALQPFAVAQLLADESGQTAQAPDKNRQICRVETPTGSIRPVRTCHTRAEWDAEAQQHAADRDQLNSNKTRQQSLSSARG